MEFETPSKISGEDFIAYIDSEMEKGQKEKKIVGAAVAVTKGDEIVFKKGYGYADLEEKRKVDPDTTVFEYGSVTKLFTWISLAQLSEEGKIDLEKDVKEYLPKDFEVPRSYEKPVRVIDLMNHQGGFDDYMIGLFAEIEAIGENRIRMRDETFTQVAPYLYQNEENGIHAYFTVKDGKVEKFSYLIEFAPVAFSTKLIRGYSYAALGLFLVLTVVFLVYSFVFWIRKGLKRDKAQGVLCGILFGDISFVMSGILIWNLVCIFQKVLSFENFSALRGNLIGNRILEVLLCLSSVAAVVFLKKQQGKAGRFLTAAYAVSVGLLLGMLLLNGAFSLAG